MRVEPLTPGCGLPALVTPAVDRLDLAAWAADNRPYVEALLLQHGGILFRGFAIEDDGQFEGVARAVSELMDYRERSSPRSEVRTNIYTSTDYPADQEIFPHNEHSYAVALPLKLLFYCQMPSDSGGQTPLTDIRRLTARLDPAVLRRFADTGWMWVRNYGSGFGLSWQTVFRTEDKSVVERYCAAQGIETLWNGDKLRTRQVRPATVHHPRTQELLWFNHATFFHVSTLPAALREPLLARFAEDELPNHTFYGDGTPIENSVLCELRELYTSESVLFDWQRRDVLLIDNLLTAHARRPFSGARRVLVAMGDVWQRLDLTHALQE